MTQLETPARDFMLSQLQAKWRFFDDLLREFNALSKEDIEP
jgi:hypothetical protein